MDSMGAFKIESFDDGEERYADRHALALETTASANGGAAKVQILNVSATGLLVASELPLELDEMIEVELPLAGMQTARVVWCNDGYYGCALSSPVSTATVSAARLRSHPLAPPAAATAVELPASQSREYVVPLRAAEPDALTLPQKAATILTLAVACWGVVIGGVILVI